MINVWICELITDPESDTIMIGASTEVNNKARKDETNNKGDFYYWEDEFRLISDELDSNGLFQNNGNCKHTFSEIPHSQYVDHTDHDA